MSAISSNNLLSVITEDFSFDRGHPLPLGTTTMRGGINFSLFARHATAVSLVLFLPDTENAIAAFPFDPKRNRTGDVWHAFISGLDTGIEYAYQIEGSSEMPHCYNHEQLVADPYALALNNSRTWGEINSKKQDYFRRALIVDTEYDWEFDQPINRPLSDSIIYEVHVRGFTQSPTSKVNNPGTFRGLIDKIPYLQELGITAVELLPITEFDELDNIRTNPDDNSPLYNFWGYHPLAFFAPKAAYAANHKPGSEVKEFKDMVKALHAAGIEIILDVVFNHTGEGDHRGSTFSFKGVDNAVYYMIAEDNTYMNYSGCGNTINCNHPFVRQFILDNLRYWVTEMHVDGFRFDLASILGRDQDGSVLSNPPLLEQIAGDPVLSGTKLIAEAWDAAGLYQVGSFPNWGRWAEWNGKFRDDIRDFVRGEQGTTTKLATRLAGSADLYQSERDPGHGINFITSHDGFTLCDLVSYNDKHNCANGEQSLDGDNHNRSWNCGEEGVSDNRGIMALRRQQMLNFATLLILSRGVPMLLSGDEIARSQSGNNNAYCQDNEISWMNWDLLNTNQEYFHFFKALIQFRKDHDLLRHDSFVMNNGEGVQLNWHGFHLDKPNWDDDSQSLAMHLSGVTQSKKADDIFLIANSHWENHNFELPTLSEGRHWLRFIDTSLTGEETIIEVPEKRPLIKTSNYYANSRSIVVLVASASC